MRARLAPLGFLAPNAVGFAAFTLFPVVLSFCMAFPNWNMKPAVRLQFLGGRHFADLLWVRPVDVCRPLILGLYALAALLPLAGAVRTLWANFAVATVAVRSGRRHAERPSAHTGWGLTPERIRRRTCCDPGSGQITAWRRTRYIETSESLGRIRTAPPSVGSSEAKQSVQLYHGVRSRGAARSHSGRRIEYVLGRLACWEWSTVPCTLP